MQPTSLERAFESVTAERLVQDVKWGQQNHAPVEWLAILIEEIGEFARAEMEHRYRGDSPRKMREELVQVAAVAMAMLQCGERNAWWPIDSGCASVRFGVGVKRAETVSSEADAMRSLRAALTWIGPDHAAVKDWPTVVGTLRDAAIAVCESSVLGAL